MLDKLSEPREKSSAAIESTVQMTTREEFISILRALMDTLDPTGQSNYLRHESFYCQLSVFDELLKLNLVDNPENLNILELGSGSGLLSIALAQIGFSVTTSDFFEATGEKLQNLLVQSEFNRPVRFIQQNLEEDSYKFEKESYDVVVAVDVVEHIKNIKSIFNNAHSCLKPNGLLIIHTPNYARLNVRFKAIKNIFNPSWPIYFENYVKENPYLGHIREFTPRELVEVYNLFNFEVLGQCFPQAATFERLAKNRSKLLQIPIGLSWQLQEIVRQFFPWLGPVQLVVGRKK